MKYYLGLDVSTSVIGIAIIDEVKKLHALEFLSLKKTKTLLSKAEVFRDHMLQYAHLDMDCVIVEEALKMFKKGKASAQILQKLSMMNGMASWIAKDTFNCKVVHYHSERARKLAWPDLIIRRGTDKKEIVRQKIAECYPQVVWMRNRNNVIIKQSFDMSDAAVLCLAHLNDPEYFCKK